MKNYISKENQINVKTYFERKKMLTEIEETDLQKNLNNLTKLIDNCNELLEIKLNEIETEKSKNISKDIKFVEMQQNNLSKINQQMNKIEKLKSFLKEYFLREHDPDKSQSVNK